MVAGTQYGIESCSSAIAVERRLTELASDRAVIVPENKAGRKDRWAAVKRVRRFAADVPIVAVANSGDVELACPAIA